MLGARATVRAVVLGWSVVPNPALLCTICAMLAKQCLLHPKWLAPWFGRGSIPRVAVLGWSVVPDPTLLYIAYAILGPLVLEGLWFWKC